MIGPGDWEYLRKLDDAQCGIITKEVVNTLVHGMRGGIKRILPVARGQKEHIVCQVDRRVESLEARAGISCGFTTWRSRTAE